MTTEVKKESKSKTTWTKEERDLIPSYGCQLLVENANKEQVHDKKFPTDTMIVSYKVEDKIYKDLCRGPRVNIFDLYYDKFGKGSLQAIDYGNGTVNPNQWGYKAPPQKKKRRKV